VTAPDTEPGFRIAARIRSFTHAFRGLAALVASEHNAWVHAAATFAVVIAGLTFGVTRIEWALLVLAIGLVWSAEALNTAVEWIADVVSPDHDPRIGRVKDVAAGGVLIAAAAATVIGLLVFVPHLLGSPG